MLATVSGDLAAERGDLGAALHNLSVALAQEAKNSSNRSSPTELKLLNPRMPRHFKSLKEADCS